MPDTATRPVRALTDRQRAILVFIVRHLGEHQSPPSIKEIAKATDLKSNNAVVGHLKALVKKGFIEIDKKLARGMRVPALDAAIGKAAGDYLATL